MEFIKMTQEKFEHNRNVKYALYLCKCGEITEKRIDNVKYGNTKTCGKCSSRKLKKLPLYINNIKVVKDLGMNNSLKPKREAIFLCECGNEFTATVNSVQRKQKKSCGCLKHKPKIFTHQKSKHPLYRKWSGMITRTTNKKEHCYKRYGGRGIKVCDEWKNDFMAFYDWAIKNGYKDGLTIDRINNDGNYEPSNCQWLTMKENIIKDSLKFKPTKLDIYNIADRYLKENITVTELAKQYGTHKANISMVLKEQNINIDKTRRIKKCITN